MGSGTHAEQLSHNKFFAIARRLRGSLKKKFTRRGHQKLTAKFGLFFLKKMNFVLFWPKIIFKPWILTFIIKCHEEIQNSFKPVIPVTINRAWNKFFHYWYILHDCNRKWFFFFLISNFFFFFILSVLLEFQKDGTFCSCNPSGHMNLENTYIMQDMI